MKKYRNFPCEAFLYEISLCPFHTIVLLHNNLYEFTIQDHKLIQGFDNTGDQNQPYLNAIIPIVLYA